MQLGWIDFSKEERNKIISLLRLLGTSTAMDELGIGTVRNAFSDFLFPGISTQQTRAKYFVLIPYLFAEASRQSCRSPREVLDYVHRCEDELVQTLVRTSPDADGIIGSRTFKQGRTVKLKPSVIYWSGLRTVGILRYPQLSINDVCSKVAGQIRRQKVVDIKIQNEDDGSSDDADVLRSRFSVFSPLAADYDFLHEAAIPLTGREAAYLREHFLTADGTKDSLMAWLLRNEEIPASLQAIDPCVLPQPLGQHLILSQQFADFIYGAHLLYNILYAEGCSCCTEELDGIRAEFDSYASHYRHPNLDAIIALTHPSAPTAAFFRSFDHAMDTGDMEKARDIIVHREKLVKGSRAKLYHPETYRFDRPIHHYRLDYRYSVAKVILRDILTGLEDPHGTKTI